MKRLVNKLSSKFFSLSQLNLLLIGLGCLFRLKNYLENRDLWLDEASIAIGIVGSTFRNMFLHNRIFPAQPIQPLGFVLITKFFTVTLGNHEYALRLLPLLSALLSVFVFYKFLTKYVKPAVIPLALALFVFSDPLIYFAAELKHYSLDLLMSSLLLYTYASVRNKQYSGKTLIIIGILCGFAVWFSYACLFILAGIAYSLCPIILRERNMQERLRFILVCLSWLLNLTLLYKLCLSRMVKNSYLIATWDGSFMPIPVSFSSFIWMKDAIINAFSNPLGIKFPILALFLFIIGCFRLQKKNKEYFNVLFIPIFLVFIAAILQKYPFKGRVLIFLVPCFLAFIAEGATWILNKARRAAWLLKIILMGLLLFPQIQTACRYLVENRYEEENKEIMSYLRDHYHRDDFIFFSNSARYPFLYYYGSLGFVDSFPRAPLTVDGVEYFTIPKTAKIFDQLYPWQGKTFAGFAYEIYAFNEEGYYQSNCQHDSLEYPILLAKDSPLDFVKHDRVWLVISHIKPDVKDFILEIFNRNGEIVTQLERQGTAIYLFNFE